MSDYDYINDHLGGHNDDGTPSFLNGSLGGGSSEAGQSSAGHVQYRYPAQMIFGTYADAKEWSLAGEGRTFIRHDQPLGTCFISKKKYSQGDIVLYNFGMRAARCSSHTRQAHRGDFPLMQDDDYALAMT